MANTEQPSEELFYEERAVTPVPGVDRKVCFSGFAAVEAAEASAAAGADNEAAVAAAVADVVAEQRRSSKEIRSATPHPRSGVHDLAITVEEVEEEEEDEALLLVLPDHEVDSGGAKGSEEDTLFYRSASGYKMQANEAELAKIGSPHGSLAMQRSRVPSYGSKAGRKAKASSQRALKEQAPLEWNERHQLGAVENSLLPKGKRLYFSRPASLPELKSELRNIRKTAPCLVPSDNFLREIEKPDLPAQKPTSIGADAGPPTLPERHGLGGSMLDRDGKVRQWNNRSHAGVVNDGMHPLHRQYFSKESVFQQAPSQRWRRHLDHEVKPGLWHQNHSEKPVRFPPLGGMN